MRVFAMVVAIPLLLVCLLMTVIVLGFDVLLGLLSLIPYAGILVLVAWAGRRARRRGRGLEAGEVFGLGALATFLTVTPLGLGLAIYEGPRSHFLSGLAVYMAAGGLVLVLALTLLAWGIRPPK